MSVLGDVAHGLAVLGRAGMLRPVRPDRAVRMALAARRWGLGLGAAAAAAAARYGDAPCIVDERGTVTFRALDERTTRQAAALTRGGVGEGDVVAILCRNHRGIVEASVAIAKAGAHALYLNTGFAPAQAADVAAREGATAIVHDDEFAEHALAAGARSRVRAWTDAPGEGATLDELAGEVHDVRIPRPAQAARTIILTSGTTGLPKGAGRPQQASPAAAVAILERIPYRAGDAMVVPAPLFHSWGLANAVVALTLGSPVVLHRRFDPEQVLAAVARHRAAVLVVVPVMLARILDLAPDVRAAHDTSTLRVIASSGSALPGTLATEVMETFGDVLYNLYGSTEIGYVSIATPEDLRAAPGTAGRPMRGVEVRLLDAAGKPVPAGATGRIFARSDLVFHGYTTGGTKPVVDGYSGTGDTGHVDDAGRLFVDGREDEMIVSGGENVFPGEVEHVIAAHPDVADVAVLGVPDEEFGQRLRAVVVRRPGSTIDADAVRAHVREHLARYKVPRDVEFVTTLPRNETGKVVKRDL